MNAAIANVVDAANPLVQDISGLVAGAFIDASGDLEKPYTDYTRLQKKYPILDPDYKKVIPPAAYDAQFASLEKDVVALQALLKSNAILAAQDLGVAHAALDEALKHGDPNTASDSLNAFLLAAQKAQAAFQKFVGT